MKSYPFPLGDAACRWHNAHMEIAGLTYAIDQNGDKQWLVLGWSQKTGALALPGVGPFATKAEATEEYWRLKANESEAKTLRLCPVYTGHGRTDWPG